MKRMVELQGKNNNTRSYQPGLFHLPRDELRRDTPGAPGLDSETLEIDNLNRKS
jgi:hypothetical protein